MTEVMMEESFCVVVDLGGDEIILGPYYDMITVNAVVEAIEDIGDIVGFDPVAVITECDEEC